MSCSVVARVLGRKRERAAVSRAGCAAQDPARHSLGHPRRQLRLHDPQHHVVRQDGEGLHCPSWGPRPQRRSRRHRARRFGRGTGVPRWTPAQAPHVPRVSGRRHGGTHLRRCLCQKGSLMQKGAKVLQGLSKHSSGSQPGSPALGAAHLCVRARI